MFKKVEHKYEMGSVHLRVRPRAIDARQEELPFLDVDVAHQRLVALQKEIGALREDMELSGKVPDLSEHVYDPADLKKSLENAQRAAIAAIRKDATRIRERASSTTEYEATPSPPSGFIVALTMPPAKAVDFLDQMAIVYPKWVAEYGPGRSRWIWISQSIQVVVGHWINATLKLGSKLWPGILQGTSRD